MSAITIKKAKTTDLVKIVAIYNQYIECRKVTSDLSPVTERQRKDWFDFHLNSERYPIWSIYDMNDNLIGWASYSPFYGREAYQITTEISFYLSNDHKGQGIGSQVINFLKQQMQPLGFTTLLGFVFKDNAPSVNALKKAGFSVWGELPNIADMQTHKETLLLLGYQNQ